jgi:hypothetical protein
MSETATPIQVMSATAASKATAPATADADAAQLQALGYTSKFDRSMTELENFSLGFTYLSPVVGVYSLFAFALAAGGPPMFWWYLLVGVGQMFVCLVFGEVVSQFPISGGLYPWARRLVGKRWAWMAGWVYGCALFVSIAAVATGGAPYVAQMLGFTPTATTTTSIALVMIGIATLCNVSGTRLLARVAMFGFICELIGALVVGGYLLLFARHSQRRRQLPARIPGGGSRRHVLLLRIRGLRRRRRGDAGCQPHDSAGHAHDHLRWRRRRDVCLPGADSRRSGHGRGHRGEGHGPGRDDSAHRPR